MAADPSATRPSTLRLKDRDVQLVLACATARFLSLQQLKLLFFPTSSEEVAKKRLAELCGAGRRPARPALLRRLHTTDSELKPVFAFTPTDAGWTFATGRLPRPLAPQHRDFTSEFLIHNLGLADAFVGLVLAANTSRKPGAVPDLQRLPFLWRSGHLLYLPWQESDGLTGKRTPRVLSPDAVVDFPADKLRLLIEYETGSHTLVPESPRKRNATVTKAERYGRFLHREEPSPYAKHFPDGYQPELVFLTPRDGRARSIASAVRAAVDARQVSARLCWRALTVEDFLARHGASLPEPKPTTRERYARLFEVARRHFQQTAGAIHAAREHLRRINAAHGLSLALPDYPASAAELKAVLHDAPPAASPAAPTTPPKGDT